ncbi:MAG TPA: hypothetical protein VK461_08315 [Acidimicrobiales bacterium]|nr:hypothetical protein [Acidimicrobiales bacterium]
MHSEEDPSDAVLVAAVAAVVREPRVAPADSFVLHAPLELAARLALLPHVAPEHRSAARTRIEEVASTFDAFGPAVDPPPERDFASLADGASRLAGAIASGDLDEVDATAAWLGRRATGRELRSLLSDLVVPSLAAAAHGTIFLFQMPRVAPRGELTSELLRPLARELARQPHWRLRWFEGRSPAASQPAGALFDALRAVPRLGVPGSDFIYPLMSQVERTGVAASLLSAPTANVDFHDAARVTLRAAALSMLQEPGDHAPYGWSHCLTLPQAALGVAPWCADPSAALAVAATYVVGFRAALAHDPLEATWSPDNPRLDVASALDTRPDRAAAAAWHTRDEDLGALRTTLATRASVHHDAHLVKYTLACLDAADAHRADARLYLAAAARLHGWWVEHDLTTAAVASA